MQNYTDNEIGICGRSFKLISFPYVWEGDTLAAVHSSQLSLFDYCQGTLQSRNIN